MSSVLHQVVLNIAAGQWIHDPLFMLDNRGVIAEAFIGQEIIAYTNPGYKAQLYYWHREAKSSNAEIDYLFQVNDKLIPIEIKSGKEGRMKSMHLFLREHKSDYGIRFYSGLPNSDKGIKSLPLYCSCLVSSPMD